MRRVALILVSITLIGYNARAGNFELLFAGHGDIASYIYFDQNAEYFIDTDLNVSVETIRYKKFFLTADLYEETSMGRKYGSNMVFDPTRARWSFGLSGRIEMQNHFWDFQFHHDCFHSIDRWEDRSIYWNSPRIGFGNLNYLPKYKYHHALPEKTGFQYIGKFDYYVLASFFAPKGASFQKTHDYNFTLDTNLRWNIARYRSTGIDIESNNFWVINNENHLKRRHQLNFNCTFYGQHGAFVTYIGWWPFDNQSIRNKDGKTVFGIHLGF